MAPDHPYDPNVTNCSEHDMGDCPYHKDGPCQWRGADGENEFPCGLDAAAHEPAVWTPRGRLPMGQYHVTLTVTGDDLGPDNLAWLIERCGTAGGFIVSVERMQRIGGDRRG